MFNALGDGEYFQHIIERWNNHNNYYGQFAKDIKARGQLLSEMPSQHH